MTDSDWLDQDTQGETLEENAARGGFFSMSGRRAAIRQALPLVGRYFQSRGNPLLRTHGAIARAGQPVSADERLLAGLRLRAALAASEQLLAHLEEVARRPTFRYALTQAESVGELQGSLDLARYVARPPLGGEPPRYPIIDVRRSTETPENIMCAYVALWMNEEMSYALGASDATADSPESVLAADLLERFDILLATPALNEGLGVAHETLMRGTEDHLLERVEERLRRGEVGNAQPYEDLLATLLHLRRHGPTGAAGDALWSFYDDSFDARLFELWCLNRLGEAISEELAVDMPPVEPEWAGGGLTFCWSRPVGTLELHSQRSLRSIIDTEKPRWLRPNGKTIRGIPDFIAKAVTHTGVERVALLDAKLRQRTGPPTEELYKVLGYFNNFSLDESPRGAILYHAPQEEEPIVYIYEDEASSGLLLATALNPSVEEQVTQGLRPIAEMVVGMLGLPPISIRDERIGARAAGDVVHQRLTELEAIAVTLSPQTLDSSMKRLRAALGDLCWACLDEDTQRMVATAEHVGFFLDSDADFSGPVLGLLSPLEALLKQWIIEPARVAHPEIRGFRHSLTLGAALDMITHAVDGHHGASSAAIREVIDADQISYARLRATVDQMNYLNVHFRRPAAHKEILSEQQWLDVYSKVVVGGALLCEVVDLLLNPGEGRASTSPTSPSSSDG